MDYSRLNDCLKIEKEKNFLEMCNSKLEEDEYYKIIIDVGEYDGSVWTTESITFKVPSTRTYEEKVFNCFGKVKIVHKPILLDKKIGIYALRDKTGLYEMVTGKKITVYGYSGQLYCYGAYREKDLVKIGNDLKFLDANPQYKSQYIDSLISTSELIYSTRRALDQQQQIIQQKKDSTIQYVKSYRRPHN